MKEISSRLANLVKSKDSNLIKACADCIIQMDDPLAIFEAGLALGKRSGSSPIYKVLEDENELVLFIGPEEKIFSKLGKVFSQPNTSVLAETQTFPKIVVYLRDNKLSYPIEQAITGLKVKYFINIQYIQNAVGLQAVGLLGVSLGDPIPTVTIYYYGQETDQPIIANDENKILTLFKSISPI